MKSTARVFILSIVVLVIASHFTLLVVHALFPNKYSFYYTYPFFQQNWNLFVPSPSENFDLYCLYLKNGSEIKKNLLQEILNDHKNNPFSGNELLLNGLLSSIYYYKNEQSMSNLKVLEHFTKQVLEYSENTPIESLRIVLVVNPVDSLPPVIYTHK